MATSEMLTYKPMSQVNLKSIPVVHYSLFTNRESVEEPNKMKFVDLEKIIRLLSHPHSATLYERHSLALNKMGKYCSKGFLVKDGLAVSRLVSICADRVTVLPQVYLEPLLRILQLCSLPALRQKTSDRLLYHKIYVDLLSQIAYTLRLENVEVRLQICKTLNDLFLLEPPSNKDGCDLVYNDLAYSREALTESDVSEVLAQLLITATESMELQLALLNVLQLFSRSSDISCNKIIAVNGANNLYTITSLDLCPNVVFRSVDVLWNLFEFGDKSALSTQLSHVGFIRWIRDAFLSQLSRGYSIAERQLRNDLLVVVTQLAQVNPDAPFVETGFAKELILLATFQEVKSHHPLVKNLKLALNHEDFELKKMLINLMVLLSDNNAMLPLLEEGQFLLALFTNMMPPASERAATSSSSAQQQQLLMPARSSSAVWKPAYREELQLHALAALATLAPRMASQFQDLCGVSRLLLMLDWCIGSDMTFAGNGNGFHCFGGRGNKLAQMRYTMRLILKIVRINDDVINQEFIGEGCISMFSDILANVVEWQHNSNSAVDLEIQCDMLFTLACLCERDLHAKELFGEAGVAVLVGFLKICERIAGPTFGSGSGVGGEMNRAGGVVPAEANGVQKLIIATVDAVWGCLIGCYFTEHLFLDQNGAFLLLDILQILPPQFYPQMLGCLVDLSENAKTLSHLSGWRGPILVNPSLSSGAASPVQTNIAHLLCRIWRVEEARLGVSRGPCSTLNDLEAPLLGQDFEGEVEGTTSSVAAGQPSRAVLEVSESPRANIYSLLSRLGYLDHPGLQLEDHVTLTIIESYLDFKVGEVWTEIQSELERDDMRPVSPDVEALEWISRSVEQEGIRVSKVQQELLEAKTVQDDLREFKYYNQLRENHRQKEKNIQHFADFVERTSDYSKLAQARQFQLANIDASRIAALQTDPHIHTHTVGVHNTNVTKFFANTINLDSTPPDVLGGKLVAMDTYGVDNVVGKVKHVIMSASPPISMN